MNPIRRSLGPATAATHRAAILLLLTACSSPVDDPGGERPAADGDGGASDGGASETGDAFELSVVLASDVDPDAPTTVGIVTWQLGQPDVETAEIRFGLDQGYGMVAPVDLSDPDHRTLLLGMKPESTYHFQFVASVGGEQILGEDHTIQTGAAPPIPPPTVTRWDGSEPGFTVMTEFALPQAARQGWVYIIDADGDVVWWYRAHFVNQDGLQDSANAARMSADGHSMWMLSYEEGDHTIERVSMDTLDSEMIAEPHASHDLVALSTGDCVAYVAYTPRQGKIREVCAGETEGRLVSDISVQGGTADHLNALRYKQDEDLLIVSDHLFDVYAVDRMSGDVQWKLSELTSLSWGGRQHGVEPTDDSVLIFANDGGEDGASAAVEYSRTTGEELFRYDSGLFTHQLGDVQRLPGGNTQVTYSAIGTRHQVTPDGEVVMVMEGPNSGYGWWRPTLYGPPPE